MWIILCKSEFKKWGEPYTNTDNPDPIVCVLGLEYRISKSNRYRLLANITWIIRYLNKISDHFSSYIKNKRNYDKEKFVVERS